MRTLDQLLRRHEVLLDAIEHNRMTSKQMEQYNMALKGQMRLVAGLPLDVARLYGKYAANKENVVAIIPQSAFLKELIPQGLLPDGKVKKLA